MTSKGTAGAGRWERRTLSAEFKAEAVRMIAERRAGGVTLAEVGHEQDIRPDQLRTWTQHARHARRSAINRTAAVLNSTLNALSVPEILATSIPEILAT